MVRLTVRLCETNFQQKNYHDFVDRLIENQITIHLVAWIMCEYIYLLQTFNWLLFLLYQIIFNKIVMINYSRILPPNLIKRV